VRFILTSVLAIAVIAGSGGVAGASSVPKAAETTSEPKAAEGDSSHVWHNLTVLLKDSWTNVAAFIGKIILFSILGAALFFAVGVGAGVVIWVVLRRRGAFDLQLSWNRYVKWAWCPLIVLSSAFALAYGGLFVGAGHVVKTGIMEDRVVDRTVAAVYCAVALDEADYELKADETLEQIETVLRESEGLGEIIVSDVGRLAKKCVRDRAARRELSPVERWFVESAADSTVGRAVIWRAKQEVDPALVIVICFAIAKEGPAFEEFLAENPEATHVVAAFADMFRTIREELCSFVNSLVYTQLLLSALIGLGAPLLLLALTRLTVRLCDASQKES
jgi:hypothetical protein